MARLFQNHVYTTQTMKTVFTKTFIAAGFTLLSTYAANAAEFFIKVNRNAQHSVSMGDQYQTNSTNIFRFFELPAGTILLKIADAGTGNLVYDGSITVGYNERLVAEMDAWGNIVVIGSFNINYTNWYMQNNAQPNNNTPPPVVVVTPPPPPPVPAGPVAVSDEKLADILAAIKAQNVESYKVDKAKSILKKNMFTSRQVADICNLFSVESYKLDVAKYAYDYTVDPENYFLVSKTFKVSSYSRDLDKYVDNH